MNYLNNLKIILSQPKFVRSVVERLKGISCNATMSELCSNDVQRIMTLNDIVNICNFNSSHLLNIVEILKLFLKYFLKMCYVLLMLFLKIKKFRCNLPRSFHEKKNHFIIYL